MGFEIGVKKLYISDCEENKIGSISKLAIENQLKNIYISGLWVKTGVVWQKKAEKEEQRKNSVQLMTQIER